MKAKRIKKYKERLKLQNYTVRETFGLFGDFNGYNRMGCEMNDCTISASNAYRAVIIYMRQYELKYKQRNEHERSEYDETTRQWARIRVTDEGGYKTYFK